MKKRIRLRPRVSESFFWEICPWGDNNNKNLFGQSESFLYLQVTYTYGQEVEEIAHFNTLYTKVNFKLYFI